MSSKTAVIKFELKNSAEKLIEVEQECRATMDTIRRKKYENYVATIKFLVFLHYVNTISIT